MKKINDYEEKKFKTTSKNEMGGQVILLNQENFLIVTEQIMFIGQMIIVYSNLCLEIEKFFWLE